MKLIDRIKLEYDAARGKSALPTYIQDREHIFSTGASGRNAAPTQDTFESASKIYEYHTWVRKAITVIQRSITPLPVGVKDKNDKFVEGHVLTPLLSNGNATNSQDTIWEQWIISKLLTGMSFFEVVDNMLGQPLELWHRRTDLMEILEDTTFDPKRFPRIGGYRYDKSNIIIDPGDIWYDRFVNPTDPWTGISVLSAVREGVQIDAFAQAWSKWFLQNNARPDYAIIAPQGITRTEKDEIIYNLMKKAGLPIVLEEGITDIKTMSFTPKDTEWLLQREFARDEVAAIFGVPDEVMGYGRDTYENYGDAHSWFWKLTLKSLCDSRDRSLTHMFTRSRPLLAPGERVATDYSGVGALQEELLPKVEVAKGLWSMGVSYNQLEEGLNLGTGPIESGDVGFVPFSVVPITQAAAEPEPMPDMTPVDDNEPEDDTEQEDDETKGVAKKNVIYGSQQHKTLWDMHVKRLDPHTRSMVRQLQRDFQRQQNEAQTNLKAQKGMAYTRAMVADHKKAQQTIIGDLVNWQEETEMLVRIHTPRYTEAVRYFGEQTANDLRRSKSFDESSPFVQAAIKEMVIQFARDINATTQIRMADKVREILQYGDDNNLSTEEIRQLIYEGISLVFNVRKTPYETRRIARTEMNKASSTGTLEAGRQSGERLKKGWIAALDDTTRRTHVQAHIDYAQNPIGPNDDFLIGTDKMQAPGLGREPKEIIHCRCALYWVKP